MDILLAGGQDSTRIAESGKTTHTNTRRRAALWGNCEGLKSHLNVCDPPFGSGEKHTFTRKAQNATSKQEGEVRNGFRGWTCTRGLVELGKN